MTQPLCLVCGQRGRIALGIRARIPNSANAVWSPNLEAFLCDEHASSGCSIEVNFRPATDGRVRTTTSGPLGSYESVLRIGTGRKEVPGQGSLL